MKFFEHLWVRVISLQLLKAQFPCQEGVFAVLVCRVTMGKMNVTSSDTEAGEKVKRMEYDSTCGKRVLSALWMSHNVTNNDEMCCCDITSGTRCCNENCDGMEYVLQIIETYINLIYCIFYYC
jgi:hypothetical protein